MIIYEIDHQPSHGCCYDAYVMIKEENGDFIDHFECGTLQLAEVICAAIASKTDKVVHKND